MMLLVCALALFCFVVLIAGRRLMSMFDGNSQRLDMILSDESLAARYRPMARLLSEGDWEYLASQPGFTPSRIRAIRSQRRQVFRRYLKCLSGDFAAICLLVRALMVQSEVPRPDLARKLFQCRFTFATALLRVEYSLIMHALGLRSVRIETASLVKTLEEICSQVRNINVSAAPALA